MLGWRRDMFYAWLRYRHLPLRCAPVRLAKQRYLFPRSAFPEWRAQVMTVAEAAVLWGVAARAVKRWAKEGVLPLLSGVRPRYYLFSRAALTQQREGWLTAREVAALPGVTEEAVRRWLQKGILAPVACPNAHVNQPHYWFLKAEVLRCFAVEERSQPPNHIR